MGARFLRRENLTWSRSLWQPGPSPLARNSSHHHSDNFGHDSELPTRAVALGMDGVAFARIPGSCMQFGDGTPSGMRFVLFVFIHFCFNFCPFIVISPTSLSFLSHLTSHITSHFFSAPYITSLISSLPQDSHPLTVSLSTTKQED